MPQNTLSSNDLPSLSRRQLLSGSVLAAASFTLEGYPFRKLVLAVGRNSLDYGRGYLLQKPKRSFTELSKAHPTFFDYLNHYLKERDSGVADPFDIAEGLLYFSKQSADRGLCDKFHFEACLAEFYDFVNQTGIGLVEKHSWLDRVNKGSLKEIKLLDKFKVVQLLFESFYSRFSVSSREGIQGEFKTLADLLAGKGGLCEDLAGAFIAMVQILRRGGLALPIYPINVPSHIYACWEDRSLAEIPEDSPYPLFFLELNTPGGKICSRSEVLNSRFTSPDSSCYLRAVPFEAVLASELQNRAGYNTLSSPRDIQWGKDDLSYSIKLCPTGSNHLALSRLLHFKERDNINDALMSVNRSLTLDPNQRRGLSHRAKLYQFEAARQEIPVRQLIFYKLALEDLRRALQKPLLVGDIIGEWQTEDHSPRTEELLCRQTEAATWCYLLTGDNKYWIEAGRACTGCIENVSDDSPERWMIWAKATSYQYRAFLFETKFDQGPTPVAVDLQKARKDRVNLVKLLDKHKIEEKLRDFSVEEIKRLERKEAEFCRKEEEVLK